MIFLPLSQFPKIIIFPLGTVEVSSFSPIFPPLPPYMKMKNIHHWGQGLHCPLNSLNTFRKVFFFATCNEYVCVMHIQFANFQVHCYGQKMQKASLFFWGHGSGSEVYIFYPKNIGCVACALS